MHRHRNLSLPLALLLLLSQVLPVVAQNRRRDNTPPPSQPQPARPAADAGTVPKISFEKYTLPNGLQVILHVDRKLPVVHVNQWFHVGSKNERIGRSGFAHLFEHMMFQGSKNASQEYFEYVEAAGANLFEGGVNGTTNQDRTNYFATVPSGNLEQILWLESDRLATLPDALTAEKLNNQRDVVKNERRQGLGESALRPLVQARHGEHLPEPPPLRQRRDRRPRRPDGREPGRREGVLQDLLHAEQHVARHRRRLRPGRGQAARRKIFRHHPRRTRARPPRQGCAKTGRRKDRRGQRPRAAGADLLRLARARLLRPRRRRA